MQGSCLLAFEGFGFAVLWAFWLGLVVGVCAIFWVLGLWELLVYVACVLRGALHFQ
jgi:hypothetical protein